MKKTEKKEKEKKEKKEEAPPEPFFKNLWRIAFPQFSQDSDLRVCLGRLRITNIVTTFNLNVKDIALSRIAGEHAFCNYHRGTFAAMGVRIPTPKCSALIYPAGVVVCMGTQSVTNTWMAACKYVEVLNERVGIPCEMTGLQVDNYVCSVLTFQLDLDHGIKPEWTNVIEFDTKKFPGAIVRCRNIKLPFVTNVHMALFRSGKINITGARSLYEALYVFVCVYFEYLVHLRKSRRRALRETPAVWKVPKICRTDIRPALTENHHEHVLRFMDRAETLQQARGGVRMRSYSRKETPPGAAPQYVAEYDDGTVHDIDIAGLEHIAPEEIDLIIGTAALSDF